MEISLDEVGEYNRRAWDQQVDLGGEWTKPVSREAIAAARRGDWDIVLTPLKPVPREWFPELKDCRVLCLAASGGQQAAILSAAGALVTVLDNSPKQLAQDRRVADENALALHAILGDMRDLSCFSAESFDLVVHPVSNCFVPEVRPVWQEISRVLRPGGLCLSGFYQPAALIFDENAEKQGQLVVRHPLPYSDLTSLTEAERDALVQSGEPFLFGHSLEDQIGGQIDSELVVTGFMEDLWPDRMISRYMPSFAATKSMKWSF